MVDSTRWMVLRQECAKVEFCEAYYVRDGEDEVHTGDSDRRERKFFLLVDFCDDGLAIRVFAGQLVLVKARSCCRHAGRQIINEYPANFSFPIQTEVSIEKVICCPSGSGCFPSECTSASIFD